MVEWIRHSGASRRTLAAALLAAVLTGCSSYRSQTTTANGQSRTPFDWSNSRTPIQQQTLADVAAELQALESAVVSTPTDRARAQRRFIEIVAAVGWPSEDLVGRKGSDSALFLMATLNPDHTDRYQETISTLKQCDEVSPEDRAWTLDRISVQQHGVQIYGTALKLERCSIDGLIAVPAAPILSPDSLDNRRSMLGLEPWEHYRRTVADSASSTATMGLLGR